MNNYLDENTHESHSNFSELRIMSRTSLFVNDSFSPTTLSIYCCQFIFLSFRNLQVGQ